MSARERARPGPAEQPRDWRVQASGTKPFFRAALIEALRARGFIDEDDDGFIAIRTLLVMGWPFPVDRRFHAPKRKPTS